MVTILSALGVLVVAAIIAKLRTPSSPPPLPQPEVIWDFSINSDLCIGCDKCVKVCPRDVLELEPSTQIVQIARPGDCIQCRACDKTCPTKALQMFQRGGPEPEIELPALDEHYQPTGVSGLYLVGEPAGKPRIKNAINLGQAAVEHIVLSGLTERKQAQPEMPPAAGSSQSVDVAIIGAGPAGLAAAVACTQHGLSYVLLAQDAYPLSTIVRYPKGKLVHALPHDLECLSPLQFEDCSKEELVSKWQDVKAAFRIAEQSEVVVTDVRRRGSGFDVVTDRRGVYQAERVIVAIGGRGQPRLLERVSLEEQSQPHVHKLLDNPDVVRGKKVLVVGGGDAAVEAALALCPLELGNTVYLVYYKNKKFLGANKENLSKLFAAERRKDILILDQAEVVGITATSVTVERKKRSRTLEIDEIYVLIGSSANKQFLDKLGIKLKRFPHKSFSRGATDNLIRSLRVAQRQKGIAPPATVLSTAATASAADEPQSGAQPRSVPDIWTTTFEPDRAEQVRMQYEQSAVASQDVVPEVSEESAQRQSSGKAPGVGFFVTRFEPNRLDGMAPLQAQVKTVRISAEQQSGTPPPLPPSSVPPTAESSAAGSESLSQPDPKGDSSVYRTIRIPEDLNLMRMPSKAIVPKDAVTRAQRELAMRTTERKSSK